jgi:hypothetical protein
MFRKSLLAVAMAASLPMVASAQTVSPVQSTARPHGFQPHASVMLSGTDADSQAFNNTFLPAAQNIINQFTSEGAVFQNVSAYRLDASRLYLGYATDKPIRVYFISEGAGYMNSLGFQLVEAGNSGSAPSKLIFPNSSQAGSIGGTTGAARSNSYPLRKGDFMTIGHAPAGRQLDFFLVSNGASNPNNPILWNDASRNVDGLQHVAAFAIPNSDFLLIGFEDIIGGGDRDYNDLLFAARIGGQNVQYLVNPSSLPH